MSRLIDRMFSCHFRITSTMPARAASELGRILQRLRPHVLSRLEHAQVIVIDNVANYFYAGTDQEEWSWDEDFPCVAPPFETFWMEMLSPHTIVSRVHGVLHDNTLHAVGTLVEGIDLDSRQTHAAVALAAALGMPSTTKWLLHFAMFAETRKGHIYPLGFRLMALDKHGAMACPGDPPRRDIVNITLGPAEISRLIDTLSLPFGLALTFLHCRNVVMVERQAPADAQRAREQRRRRPLFRYHVLEIEPLKRVLAVEGNAAEVGLRRALHICRGHFKDYRQRGLFGKHRGIYWWESYVRGELHSGVVTKDYEVSPLAAATGGIP
jgi:hypothetical protein